MGELVTARAPEARRGAAERVPVLVSLVVRVTERPEDLARLYAEYVTPLRALGEPFEVVFALEPWAQPLVACLAPLAAQGHPIRIVRVGQPLGEGALLRAAAAQCRGSVILTVPAYFRVDVAALVEVVRRVSDGADVAAAVRWPRRDSWINRLQSRALHFLLGRLVGGRLRDVACGIYAVRRKVLDEVPLYGDFFRFLPLLAWREGYRVEEVPAPQHERDRRTRVYSPGVYIRRLIDVLGLFFLLRFTEKPLRFFGLVGTVLGAAGAAVLAILAVQRLGGEAIANRPLLLVGNLLIVLGVQAFALGLIGEIIVHLHAGARRPYRLAAPPQDER